MTQRILFAVLLLAGLTFGCGEGAVDQDQLEKDLANEVMDIHDEVMPKMAEVNRFGRTLRSYYEDNKETISADLDGQMELIQRELDAADDGMMGWMANYQALSTLKETMDHQAIMDYLSKEKEEISKVKDQINTSIEKAKKLIESLPESQQEEQ